MSQLSREQILKLAKLSNLRLSEEEITKYQNELSKILDFVESLDTADTTGLEPTYQVTGLVNRMRPDTVSEQQPASPDALLNVVPKTNGRYIQVGRMI